VIHHEEKKYFAVRRGENTRQTRYFAARFIFDARQNARQRASLPCARYKTHGKDFDARQT
jgi:hypothetical protein